MGDCFPSVGNVTVRQLRDPADMVSTVDVTTDLQRRCLWAFEDEV